MFPYSPEAPEAEKRALSDFLAAAVSSDLLAARLFQDVRILSILRETEMFQNLILYLNILALARRVSKAAFWRQDSLEASGYVDRLIHSEHDEDFCAVRLCQHELITIT